MGNNLVLDNQAERDVVPYLFEDTGLSTREELRTVRWRSPVTPQNLVNGNKSSSICPKIRVNKNLHLFILLCIMPRSVSCLVGLQTITKPQNH